MQRGTGAQTSKATQPELTHSSLTLLHTGSPVLSDFSRLPPARHPEPASHSQQDDRYQIYSQEAPFSSQPCQPLVQLSDVDILCITVINGTQWL